MKTLAAALLLAPALLAQNNIPNITGTWTVIATSNLTHRSYQVSFELMQNAGSISGEADISGIPCAQSGPMSGTVSGDGTFNFAFTVSGQQVTFSGTISVNGDSASGSYQAPPGGCTDSDTGTWTATRQAPALPHFYVSLLPVANLAWSSLPGGSTIPVGGQTYNGIPFIMLNGPNNAWAGSFTTNNPSSVTIQPWVVNAITVHTLMNTMWGSPGPPPLATITFTGSAGATYTQNLIGGSDLRDITAPSNFTDTINGSTAVNAWTGQAYNSSGNFHRLDHQTFNLPIAFATQTLTSITINDVGSPNVQRVILAGLTVDGTDAPVSFTITGGNHQSGAAGSALPTKLSVLVKGMSSGVAGVTVNFTVSSGWATLSAASAVTDATGTAAVSVMLGQAGGPVVVSAAVAGNPLLGAQFNLTGTGGSCPIGVPAITSVKSATDYGGLPTFAPGSWLEIKGTNLTVDTTPRQWATGDFQGNNAPTSLDGSKVTINGHAGFVGYVSAGQINAQAPADSVSGSVQVSVTTCAGTSLPASIQETAASPGILAPASFLVSGKQYAAATFTDFVTFVGNTGLVAGAPFRPAKPGDTIVLYGVGFGAVTPAIAPGVIVTQANSLPNLSISFDSAPALNVTAGLAGNFIGLYEFYLTVPQVSDGDHQINITAGGTPIVQTVYLTTHQ